MPRHRQGAGGTRAGTPGIAYPNRSDLNANRNLPARVATGQTYGRAQQQLQAQRTVPMAPEPAAPLPPPAPAPPASTPPSARMASPATGPLPAPSAIAPGSFGPLERPSERPNEPVTSGAPLGPGPTTVPGVNTQGAMASMLARAAQATGSAALHELAAAAAQNGQ